MLRLIGCVACLCLAACGAEDEESWSSGGGGAALSQPAAGTVASAGQALYAQNCAHCHGQNGGNVKGRRGITGVVRRGTDGMPAFPDMSSADISAIEAYLNGARVGSTATSGGNGSVGTTAPSGGYGGEENDDDDD